MGLFNRTKYIQREKLLSVAEHLSQKLEWLREDYINASITQLKRCGSDISNLSRDIPPGSELEDILKAFQLVCIMGIAWKYIRSEHQIEFDKILCMEMKTEWGKSRADQYREKYLDCQGDVPKLTYTFAKDIHRVFGSPVPDIGYLTQFKNGAFLLINLCQAETYAQCGDEKMARKMKEQIAIP